jgi:hypothetical protein
MPFRVLAKNTVQSLPLMFSRKNDQCCYCKYSKKCEVIKTFLSSFR